MIELGEIPLFRLVRTNDGDFISGKTGFEQ
jgi:hypothetical protein